jgi:hypothetical protein
MPELAARANHFGRVAASACALGSHPARMASSTRGEDLARAIVTASAAPRLAVRASQNFSSSILHP